MSIVEPVLESKISLTSPSFDTSNNLYFCCSQTGDLQKMDSNNNVEIFANTKGVPNSITFDHNGDMYICDFAHQAVLTIVNNESQISEFIREYEGKPFKGPNSLIVANDGTIFFTDSGPFGESTLHNPTGSVFSITKANETELLQPLALECLAYPCGLAIAPNQNIIYVAETLQNRILRFIQKPVGVYHFSVFYQFSGFLGPTAIETDNKGNLYVARFDFQEGGATEGMISVISPEGQLVTEINVPGCEITGLKFDIEKRYLYISEASTKKIYRLENTFEE